MKTLILAVLIAALGGLLFTGVFLLRPSTPVASVEVLASEPQATELGEALRASPVSARASASSERRASEVPSEAAGTVLLVVDAVTDEPIERFGISLRLRSKLARGSTPAASSEPTIKDVPGGALSIDLPLEGARFHVRAPGYLPLSGEIELDSEVDRRVFIRLDPAVVVRGRAVFEGEPVAGASVRLQVLSSLVGDSRQVDTMLQDHAVTNADGVFEFSCLAAKGASISVRRRAARLLLVPCGEGEESASHRDSQAKHLNEPLRYLTLERDLGDLEVGTKLDLGDVELTMIQGSDSHNTTYVNYTDRSGTVISSGGIALGVSDLDTLSSTEVESGVPYSFGFRERRAAPSSKLPEPAHLLVQASEGGRALTNARVRFQPEAGGVPKEVGITDDQGELLTQVNSGGANYIQLFTRGGLPIGQSEAPLFATSGEELVVPLRLDCGRLVLEIPSTFTPSVSSALLLRIATDAQPKTVSKHLTLRDEDSALLQTGIEWTGNRCVLPSLAPGNYTIGLDIMRKVRNTPQSSVLPTGLRFAGVARVTVGAETVCVLSAN